MSNCGYFRVAAVVPMVKPAAVRENADGIIQNYLQACDRGAELVLFPELSITAYTCGDLFLQSRLLQSAEEQALRVIDKTSVRGALMVFGIPLSRQGRVFNVAVVAQGGRGILGIIPKTYIPNFREYYENRWFASADEACFDEVNIAGRQVPFGTNILFRHEGVKNTAFAVELCEDLWSPIPPSSRHAIAGSQMIFNLSASSELVGKADYRRSLITQQSARCHAAYIFTSAGLGESSTDTVYGGHALIAENGRMLAESRRFQMKSHMILADVDIDLLDHERRISRTFGLSARREIGDTPYRVCHFSGSPQQQCSDAARDILHPIHPRPFVPRESEERRMRCEEITAIQASALATRIRHTGLKHVVIGLSGGMDSTLAFLISIQAFKFLALPKEGIHALTMPGFGTTGRTLENVEKLCGGLGIALEKLDIREACSAQMEDLGHKGEQLDTAYENIQARYRMSILMNKANMIGGLVIGTGDLSELALGWCTYNGDHMSMYGVNCGVPKTLVHYLLSWAAENWVSSELRPVLEDILTTPISPELLPPGEDGEIMQKTEDRIGPYELHDFFLFHSIRHGFRPSKVFHMASHAFRDKYDTKTVSKWLKTFYTRFFSQQFKRSCLPDGPKVGTIALSPRGDWRMPSDADVSAWLTDLEDLEGEE